jgi:hypothetical protein
MTGVDLLRTKRTASVGGTAGADCRHSSSIGERRGWPGGSVCDRNPGPEPQEPAQERIVLATKSKTALAVSEGCPERATTALGEKKALSWEETPTHPAPFRECLRVCLNEDTSSCIFLV